jgi:hypothetical protein
MNLLNRSWRSGFFGCETIQITCAHIFQPHITAQPYGATLFLFVTHMKELMIGSKLREHTYRTPPPQKVHCDGSQIIEALG